MSIVASELVWRKPVEISDNPSNGGAMSSVSAPSGVKNNILPDVPQAERTAGSTKYRKAFIHVANDEDLTLIAPKVYVMAPTPGDDRVTIIAANQTNTQTNITGTEQQYGAGTLNASVTLAATSCTVLVEDAAADIFNSGMTVRISDRQTIDGAGNEQFLVLSADATYTGNVATLTFTTTPLATGFSAVGPTYVSSCLLPGDISASLTSYSESSGTGTYNEATYPVVLDSIGTIEQLWTLTFSNATTFSVSGDTVGSVGSGNITTTFAPTNTAYSKPYFTLNSAGFGGAWANGNTISFRTHPASIPIWYKRVVPAGASSLSGNKVIVGIDGESS